MAHPAPFMTETERRAIRRAELRQFDSMRRDYAEPVSGMERGRRLGLNIGTDPANRQSELARYLKETDPLYHEQMRRMELAQALYDRIKHRHDRETVELKGRLMTVEFPYDLAWVVDLARDHGLSARGQTPGPRAGSGMAGHDDILVEALERLMTRRLPNPGEAPPMPMTAMQALRAVSQFAFGSDGSKAKRLQRRRRAGWAS